MTRPGGHRPQLDGLRTIAVLAVALYHWFDITVFGVEPPLGDLGVGLFFVLSGYLITGILVDVRDKAAQQGSSLWFTTRSFTMRRILRLVPALYLYLVVTTVAGYVSDSDGLAWYALYVGNFRIDDLGYWPSGVAHLWSLSVEEQFYLVAPAFLLLMPRRLMRPTLAAFAVMVTLLNTDPATALPTLLPPAAFVGLVVGCLLALEVGEPGAGRVGDLARRWYIPVGGAVAVVGLREFGLLSGHSLALGHLLAFVSMAVLVWKAATGFEGGFGRVLEHRSMQFVGRISYGIYLWHYFAQFLLEELEPAIGTPPALIELVLLSLITIAIAQASWWFVERHVNALKSRFPYIERRVEIDAALVPPVAVVQSICTPSSEPIANVIAQAPAAQPT